MSEDGQTCVRWTWDEPVDSFRVEIRYPAVAEVFAFVVDAGSRTFLLPHAAAPRLHESGQRCRERNHFIVLVFAQGAGVPRDRNAAYGLLSAECDPGP